MSSSTSSSHRTPRYTDQDHPLAPHNLAARGYHSFRCLGVPFHVKQRYTFVRELGIGAYGCVALCHDDVLGCNIAIKKVTRIFEKDVLARRALREVALLRHIGMCDNVTGLLDFDTAFIDFSEIYLVLSASEADLSQIIRSGQSLSDAHHQYFMAQILRGVRYMHAAKVIHRDLKPSNLLVNGDCALRICDFGLARAYADTDDYIAPPATSGDESDTKPRTNSSSSVDAERPHLPPSSANTNTDANHDAAKQPRSGSARSPSPASDLHVQLYKTDNKGKQKRLNYPGGPLTGYVATRWYRAPEVMLCFREGYGPEMDMWSVGCILAELIAGAPIFGGKDYVDQIARINNVLGSPSEAVLDKIGSERAKTYIKSLPNMPAVPLEKLYPNANPEALDLVSKLLTWDPDQRLTAQEALQHPWLKAYHESNARWQPPQPFDKFAEVELIHSLRQFKSSLQREADEMRMEMEEIEREELEHLGDDANTNGATNGDHANGNGTGIANGNGAHQDGENPTVDATNGDAPLKDEANSGKVQRADEAIDGNHHERGTVDADAQRMVPSRSQDSTDDVDDALSCNASTQSGHQPADTASSSSSIHTPSSTSGASADEAELPSPRPFEASRMATALKSRAEHLEEGKALRKPPSFFRLGHEEEGRFPYEDAFMPQTVLTVARGLVEYQTTAAAVVASERTVLPEQQQGAALERGGTIKARSASGAAGGTATGGAKASSVGSTGGGRGGGTASTPSLGQSLLDDTIFAPAEGSASGLKGVSSHRHAKQLVILQDSVVQSSVSLMRELIARTAQRNHGVLLVSTLRRPETYLDGISNAERVATIDATMLANLYTADANVVDSVSQLISRIEAELTSLNARVTKTTVLIDSLNAIAHADSVAGASKVVRETLVKLGSSCRLVVGLQMGGVEASTCSALLAALHSPLIWGPGSSAGTILSATLHPSALLRHIVKQFGLKPPSSSLFVRRALGVQAGEEGDQVDMRFWDVLRNVASRGPMGVAAYEAGGGAQGWWTSESCQFESLSLTHEVKESDTPKSSSSITLADLVNPARTGYAFLELHFQSRNGKSYEELIGLSSDLCLLPLDMSESSAPTSAPAEGDAHSSMVQGLSFNLGETSAQRQRRGTVPLPYAYHQNQPQGAVQEEENGAALRGDTGNARIFFEPEEDDDEDEEDPDDDLDL